MRLKNLFDAVNEAGIVYEGKENTTYCLATRNYVIDVDIYRLVTVGEEILWTDEDMHRIGSCYVENMSVEWRSTRSDKREMSNTFTLHRRKLDA